MKIVHISDIHISPESILGHDPIANFRACLDHVASFHGDADRVIITGDLTHHGETQSYEILKDILGASSLSGSAAPRLMIGNHDNRDSFLAAFPEAQCDGNGFVQWTEATPAGLFVYLDTVQEGTHAGVYDAPRREWLEEVLSKAREDGRGAWLFLHHNPTRVHVANADLIGIRQEAEFKALLARHRDTVRHLFFGHCHYTLSGTVAGIPFSAPRSTNHACWPDFSGDASRMGYGELTPSYSVCFIEGDDVVVHTIDFRDAAKVRWEETDDEG